MASLFRSGACGKTQLHPRETPMEANAIKARRNDPEAPVLLFANRLEGARNGPKVSKVQSWPARSSCRMALPPV